jgi:hypothetical protein
MDMECAKRTIARYASDDQSYAVIAWQSQEHAAVDRVFLKQGCSRNFTHSLGKIDNIELPFQLESRIRDPSSLNSIQKFIDESCSASAKYYNRIFKIIVLNLVDLGYRFRYRHTSSKRSAAIAGYY